MRPQYYL